MSLSEASSETHLLEAFISAWNAHDVDALMSMMTEDCQYFSAAGPDKSGQVFSGRLAVRDSFSAVFEKFEDAAWSDAQHVVAGDRGFSEWLFTGTTTEGERVEVRGCDLFRLQRGRISIKDSYRKDRHYGT